MAPAKTKLVIIPLIEPVSILMQALSERSAMIMLNKPLMMQFQLSKFVQFNHYDVLNEILTDIFRNDQSVEHVSTYPKSVALLYNLGFEVEESKRLVHAVSMRTIEVVSSVLPQAVFDTQQLATWSTCTENELWVYLNNE